MRLPEPARVAVEIGGDVFRTEQRVERAVARCQRRAVELLLDGGHGDAPGGTPCRVCGGSPQPRLPGPLRPQQQEQADDTAERHQVGTHEDRGTGRHAGQRRMPRLGAGSGGHRQQPQRRGRDVAHRLHQLVEERRAARRQQRRGHADAGAETGADGVRRQHQQGTEQRHHRECRALVRRAARNGAIASDKPGRTDRHDRSGDGPRRNVTGRREGQRRVPATAPASASGSTSCSRAVSGWRSTAAQRSAWWT